MGLAKTPNATLWLHYSGHGTQKNKSNVKAEADGRNEALVPNDHRGGSNLIDDEWLNENFAKVVPESSTAYCILDCCHSGTLLDLPYSFSPEEEDYVTNKDGRGRNVTATGYKGKILNVSGCMDSQLSKEDYDRDEAGNVRYDKDGKTIRGGVLTMNLLRQLRTNPDDVRIDTLARRPVKAGKKYTQTPQLSFNFEPECDLPFWGVLDH